MTVNAALREERFQRNLAFGQIAETDIAKWLIRRGVVVLPIYDVEYETGKGPRVFSCAGNLAAPDLLVWCKQGIRWIEAKHKTTFTWYRKTREWQTGIDLPHWQDYCRCQDNTNVETWLLFLHRSAEPASQDRGHCQGQCPIGLFGNKIAELRNPEPRSDARGSYRGMVYWPKSRLKKIAPLNEVILSP
jgi:hypothetical protein